MRRSQRIRSGATPKNFDKRIAQTRRMAGEDIREKRKTVAPMRKSKRNSTKAAPATRNFEEMLKEADNLARQSIYEDACARKPKHEGPAFRLLDLPPELRVMIFNFMVFRPYPLLLRNLVPPLITAVSKQVRAECMAGFFVLNTFQMTVETNICFLAHINTFCQQFGSLRAARQDPHLQPGDRYWIDLIYRLEPRAGGLHIQANSENWLTSIHRDVAVFRNIQVVLKDAWDHPTLCARNPTAPDCIQPAWVIESRRCPKGRIDFTVSVWHPMQLVPHFVSCPMDPATRLDYYDLSARDFMELLETNHPHFDTFNFNALRALAYAIGHFGSY